MNAAVAIRARAADFAKWSALGIQGWSFDEVLAKDNTFIANTPIVDGVAFRPAAASEPPGLWCGPHSADAARAMLYLHGGAYTMGNADAYRGFVSQIAARAQCSAFILDYPLAPEASIPVALDMALAAVHSLLAIYPQIAIAGDSAGGGLTLATLANLRDSGRVDGHHRKKLQEYIDMVERGKMKVAVARTFPLPELEETHRLLGSNQANRKIVVTV